MEAKKTGAPGYLSKAGLEKFQAETKFQDASKNSSSIKKIRKRLLAARKRELVGQKKKHTVGMPLPSYRTATRICKKLKLVTRSKNAVQNVRRHQVVCI